MSTQSASAPNTQHADPITAEVVQNALISAAHEMNNIIVRTAFNPLLFDTKDFGIAILSPSGELWAEDSGLTTFVGCTSTLIKLGIARRGVGDYRDGDVFIVNDPYLTGTHISDTTIYSPVFASDNLVAFVAVTAHWADIGGRTPGGWDMTATEIFQEGMVFSHQRLVSGGEEVRDMTMLISQNVRFPEIVRGDLDAQFAACRAGAARITALCDRYGLLAVRGSMERAIAATAHATRARIAAAPNGKWSRTVQMDYDGIDPDNRPTLSVQVEIDGETVRVGFDGTSSTSQGSMNVTAIGTEASVRAALKGLLAPLEPTNSGHFDGIRIDLPENSLVNPTRPAGSDSYGLVASALSELLVMALAEAFPDTARAGSYQLFGVYLLRTDARHGDPFIMIDPIDGGHGGHGVGDGSTTIFSVDGDTLNLPVEVLENRYPLRCLQFSLAREAGGAGMGNGGSGVIRDYQVLEAGTILKYANENTKSVLSQGVDGGEDGTPSYIVLRPGTVDEVVLTDRGNDAGVLNPGDIVRAVSGGGGGWGKPPTRERV